jgi:hypothetical protein
VSDKYPKRAVELAIVGSQINENFFSHFPVEGPFEGQSKAKGTAVQKPYRKMSAVEGLAFRFRPRRGGRRTVPVHLVLNRDKYYLNFGRRSRVITLVAEYKTESAGLSFC